MHKFDRLLYVAFGVFKYMNTFTNQRQKYELFQTHKVLVNGTATPLVSKIHMDYKLLTYAWQ